MARTEPGVLLSLFDGTGSICAPFINAGWTVKRLDLDGSHGADIVVDILNWDPTSEWQGPVPDVIFAGPPCEQYSSARTRAKHARNLELADSLVTKALAIIDHFHRANPALQFFVENPDSSMLWRRWVSHRLYHDLERHPMNVTRRASPARRHVNKKRLKHKAFKVACGDKHVVRLDYCQYKTKYRKRTRFMTNNPFKGLLCNNADCSSVVNGRHVEVAQRGPRGKPRRSVSDDTRSYHTLDQLHAYPPELVAVIFQHVQSSLSHTRKGLHPTQDEPADVASL